MTAHSNLSREELDALKARVDLAEVVRAAGVELKPKGKNLFGRCPFHEDDTPSLSVNPEARLWQCFGCRAGGDVFTFLELSEKLTFPQQLERVRLLAGEVSTPRKRKTRPAPPQPGALPGAFTRLDLLTRVAQLYGARFREVPDGRAYLESRGLDSRELWEGFQLGLADGTLRSMLPQDAPLFQALQQIGVLNERGQEHFHGCLVVPLTHPDFEGVVGLYGRRMHETGPGRHRVLPGPLQGVLNWQALQTCRRIVLAEGVFDVLALWQAGVREATCLLGCAQLPPDLEPLLGRYATREVVLCLDGDEAGHEGSRRLVEQLARRGLAVRMAALPSGTDPGSLVEGGQAEDLRALLKTAPTLATGEPSESVQVLEDGFLLELGDTSYQVRPVPPFGGRLRVRVRANRGERLHVDKLDLEAHRARHGLIVQLIRQLDLPRLDAERHLSFLLRQAEEWAAAHADMPASKLAEEAPELTPDERKEALAFLKRVDLMEGVLADMEGLGYVGEETGKLLVYLIGVSRKLRKPLSGIIRSQSGSGKSSLAELLEQLTPAEDVRFYSRISPMALSWGPTDLQHKLIILEERMGGEGADYQIRTLQSRQRISQLVAVKDPATGQMAADFREVHGPIAFLETTTQSDLNPENTTRCYEIFLDESEAQTRRIQEAQRRARVPGAHDPEELRKAIVRRHHNAQRLIEKKPVFIPYVEHVTFPTRWLRTRRDHERFLALIEASALLHQHQRKGGTTEEGTSYVLADLDDYRLAYGLTRRVLEQTFHELSQTARDLWAQARELARERCRESPQDAVFTRRDLRLRSGVMDHAVRTALTELVELEYAQVVSGCNGKTMHYRLLVFEEEGLSAVGCLTTPEELAARMRPR